ncbi:PREDICTED: uncharacterized protein LOC109226719 [Nicotiana attenuata]|uniref:Uncharacterized protein n=1 Tax=Nicotiana attenuata TaxID=49451 RepID=A0A1J6IVX3_NICAT|nr:PREDICTED: uncharacterized protein LOC109226719 [Nicotiana attenuata]OIT01871.1 hypothetical protein A4A49_00758 [Nicotiana attenuata]
MSMATQLCPNHGIPYANSSITHRNRTTILPLFRSLPSLDLGKRRTTRLLVQCSEKQTQNLRTCKNCKTQFDPLLNHPRACRYHTAHFGGETRRKFESVYAGGTMDTPDGGKVFQYWHCCGSEDPFDTGCTAAPHASYDD